MAASRELQNLGENLQLIVTRLCENQNLLKLLYYSDKDPISQTDLTSEQIKTEIFEKLIKIIPKVGPYESAQSLVAMRVIRGDENLVNEEFLNITFGFEIFVPLTQWIVKSSSLRPFLIMSEIIKSLRGKTINGLGKMVGGNFALNFLTEEMSCYELTFKIVTYD